MEKQKKRWTASAAGAVLDDADQAASDRVHAEANGINIGRVAWWRSRLRRPRRKSGKRIESPPKIAFVEVKAQPVATATTVDVLLPNGRQLRVSDRIDPALVAQLADALETQC